MQKVKKSNEICFREGCPTAAASVGHLARGEFWFVSLNSAKEMSSFIENCKKVTEMIANHANHVTVFCFFVFIFCYVAAWNKQMMIP